MYSNRSITNGDQISGQLVVDDGVIVSGNSEFQSITITGPLDANSNKIINLAEPTDDQDAATKLYVDTHSTDPTDLMTLSTDQTVTGTKTFSVPPVMSEIINIGTVTLPPKGTIATTSGPDILLNKTIQNPTLTGAVSSSTINMNNNVISNLADPSTAQDAASKNYVDAFVQGLQTKQAVRVATIGSFPSFTFADNTMTGTGAMPTVDGQTMVVGDRVLVKNKSDAQYNGIYTVTI